MPASGTDRAQGGGTTTTPTQEEQQGTPEPETARFVVRPGPPTWVVYDREADKQVGRFQFPAEAEAEVAAKKLNATHSNYRRDY